MTFTHNATSLILPGAANITTAANDRFFALSLGSGNWVVLFYEKASGTAIVSTAAATQAEMEAMASNTVFATPLNVNWHPGIAKAWIRFNGTGVIAINASHNITSITDDGVGKYTVTIATDFSSANYAALATAFNSATNANSADVSTVVAGSYQIGTYNSAGTPTDCEIISSAAFGDQ